MIAVIVKYEKDDIKDEVTYTKVKAEDVWKFAAPGMDVNFSSGKAFGEVFFFETEEEAEACMGAK